MKPVPSQRRYKNTDLSFPLIWTVDIDYWWARSDNDANYNKFAFFFRIHVPMNQPGRNVKEITGHNLNRLLPVLSIFQSESTSNHESVEMSLDVVMPSRH